MAKVAILLACYNSSKYLSEQLDSILAQTYAGWELFLRDDGSTDSTIQIIESYSLLDNRIHFLSDQLSGLGPGASFMKLLHSVDADYYFFSDHDDVWLEDKVELTLKELTTLSNQFSESPVIVHSDLFVVDQDLNIISKSFWKSSGIKPSIIANKNFIQVFNCVTGCAMAFNNKVKQIAFPYPSAAPMHDWWLSIITLTSKGIISHVKKPLIYYRQHCNNEVGARRVDGYYFLRKFGDFYNTIHGNYKQIAFLKSIGGLSSFKYFSIKLIYTIIRKL